MQPSFDLLALIGADTPLRRVAGTHGGEYAGPCPFCVPRGTDRLRVWPHHPGGEARWWCRRCERGGDAIAYLVERGDLTPAQAGRARRGAPAPVSALHCATALPLPPPATYPAPPVLPSPLIPPPAPWQDAATLFVDRCAAALQSPQGERARAWLNARGLADDMVCAARLGYNPGPADPGAHAAARWGEQQVKLYRGIVIPWWAEGELWRVNIRRPAGDPKYYSPAGCANGLYNADLLRSYQAAVVVEGELDALLLMQEAGDLAAAVALGSTSGARRARWIAALAARQVVLVALDADPDPAKGDRAAAWWLSSLPNARRCRPWWGDPGEMHQAGAAIRRWLAGALGIDPGRRAGSPDFGSLPRLPKSFPSRCQGRQ